MPDNGAGSLTLFEYSAGAFIYRKEDGRALFLVLKKENGEYDLPKGHIEDGESAEQAATREILEETGIKPHFLPFFSATSKYFFQKNGEKVLKQLKLFIAEAESPHVKISSEHKGYEWTDYDDAVKKLGFRDLVQLMPSVYDYIKRFELMKELNNSYSTLPERSAPWDLSIRFVPGEGRLDADIMIVGQAPGAEEDKNLRPFVGRSGKLLDSMLLKAGIKRKDVYISNVVQFFPPKNRAPSRLETELCIGFLKNQIDIIKPHYILLLGNFAALNVIGIGQVEKNHGKIIRRDNTSYFITFHPAAALRLKSRIPIMQSDFLKLAEDIKEKGLK